MLPLEVDSLVYELSGRRLIDDISLTLSSRGITMIMGPNGAGKSILMRLLHGLVMPASGSIRWNPGTMNDALRIRQAMVFQRPVLLRRSVAANVDFALSLRGRSDRRYRNHILRQTGLLESTARPARRLSGGEQQRLALARALATRPEVLFLDEPAASLDPASVMQIEQIVRDVSRQGVKVIMTSHDAAQAARLSQDIVFIHRGRLIEHSEAEQFFPEPRSKTARDYLEGRLLL